VTQRKKVPLSFFLPGWACILQKGKTEKQSADQLILFGREQRFRGNIAQLFY